MEMESAVCPHCEKETIRPKARFYAGLWLNVICPECEGRMCALPILMLVVYFCHMWNILFFGFMTIHDQGWGYPLAMVIFWIGLTTSAYYIPFARLRPVKPKIS